MKNSLLTILLFGSVGLLLLSTPTSGQTNGAERFVSVDDAVANALKAGAKMPAFVLEDSTGKTVSSKHLLKAGNLVVVFYRGSWCPYCNLYLRNLQKRLPEIVEAGGTLVAISVETPDDSMSVAKKNELNYTVLSDPGLGVARRFGIVYQMQPETDAQYKTRGLDVAKHNAMAKPELPLGATYVVSRKGKITYAYIENDYKKRAEPDVIIENLKKLKK
jgi:peroxiredoxin